MAEYYPLLARAIAGLPQSTADSRRAIYERARTALIGQLRAVQPPIAEADIDRESRMLDEAIERLEAEIASGALAGAAPAQPAQPAKPPEAAPPEARKPAEPLARRPEPPPLRTAPLPPRPGLPPRPNLPPRPTGPGALDAARQRLASLSRTPGPGRPAPSPAAASAVAPAPASKPESVVDPQLPAPAAVEGPPPVEAKVEPIKAGVPAIEPPKPEPTEAEIAAARLAAEGRAERREPGAAPINVTLRKYGPRAEAAGVSADLAPLPDALEDETEAAGEEPQRAVRPAAPLPREEKQRNLRPFLIGVPVAVFVALIAVFAYVRRDNPDELARLRPAPGAETQEQSTGKIVERIGGGQAARQPAQPQQPGQAQQQSQAQQPGQAQQAPQAPAQQGAPTDQQAAPPANGAAVAPVSQRAALLVDAPDEPQRVKTFVGNVVWRLENISRGQGQPLAIGVRAEVDLPDAKMKAVILIQKNTDDTLPASHTIEIRFTPTEGGPIPGVSQISTPQMRKEDTPAGDALMGVPAPILRNYFLVGLTRGDAVSRNVDLLRNRGWVDIPMLLSDQRIAKLTFEKGASGDRVINEALEAWK